MTAERYWEARWRDEAKDNDDLRAQMKNKVEIKEHERGAMINGVLLLRSLAKMLEPKDRTHAQRVLIWAQMIEDIVERMESGDKH